MKRMVWLSCLLLTACATLKTSNEYIARGNGYLKDGKKQAAIDSFNKAVTLNPQNMEAYEARGAAYFYNGQYGLAAADFERVLQENPYRFPVYTAYASTLAASGNFTEALRLLNIVDRLNAAQPETYFARAGVYYMLGHYDLAVADYTKVLQVRPCADVLNARANAYAQWGKTQLAQQDFQAAKNEYIPQNLNAYSNLR